MLKANAESLEEGSKDFFFLALFSSASACPFSFSTPPPPPPPSALFLFFRSAVSPVWPFALSVHDWKKEKGHEMHMLITEQEKNKIVLFFCVYPGSKHLHDDGWTHTRTLRRAVWNCILSCIITIDRLHLFGLLALLLLVLLFIYLFFSLFLSDKRKRFPGRNGAGMNHQAWWVDWQQHRPHTHTHTNKNPHIHSSPPAPDEAPPLTPCIFKQANTHKQHHYRAGRWYKLWRLAIHCHFIVFGQNSVIRSNSHTQPQGQTLKQGFRLNVPLQGRCPGFLITSSQLKCTANCKSKPLKLNSIWIIKIICYHIRQMSLLHITHYKRSSTSYGPWHVSDWQMLRRTMSNDKRFCFPLGVISAAPSQSSRWNEWGGCVFFFFKSCRQSEYSFKTLSSLCRRLISAAGCEEYT